MLTSVYAVERHFRADQCFPMCSSRRACDYAAPAVARALSTFWGSTSLDVLN